MSFQHEPATLEKPSPQHRVSRWRKRLFIISLIVVPLGLLGASFYFLALWQDIHLQQAIAETDQLDPGWRIRELEAKRAVLPDDQNSAVPLMAAQKLLGPQGLQNISASFEKFWDLEQAAQLDEHGTAALRDKLAPAAVALAEARKVAELPNGWYPFRYAPADYLSTHPVHVIEKRFLANLLACDVLLRAQEQDMEGALASCRAILNTVRAIGDEPLPRSMMDRMLLHHLALRQLERTLAQGQPSEDSLAILQRLLEDEAAQPLFLIGARGARAILDRALEALQNGEVSINQVWGVLGIGHTPFASDWDQTMMRTESVKMGRAALLRFNNQIVEIAKLPAEEQRQPLAQLAAAQSRLPRLVRDASWEAFGVANNHHLDLAWMRSAIVMVAVERYRLAHGCWPEALSDLVPIYLERVPTDPYGGAPLRYRRVPDGVVVYSVGEDGQDNGGNLRMPMVAGTNGTSLRQNSTRWAR